MKNSLLLFSAKRTKGRIGSLGVCFLFMFTLIVLHACSQEKEPIKIGGILALSGPGSYLQDFLNGIRMATDEINARGGINGRKLELHIEDSRTSPEEGEKAFRTLEKEQQPLLYIVNLSSVAMAVKDLAEEARAPMIASPSSAPGLTVGGQYVFRYWVNAADDIPPIIGTLNMLGVNHLGVMYLHGPYGKSLQTILEESCRRTNRSMVSYSFEADDTQFKKQIEGVIGAEAIYIGGFASHIPPIIRQIRGAGYTGHLIAASGASAMSMRSNPALDNVYLAAPILYNPTYSYANKLSQKYHEIYRSPLSHYVATGYDMIKLLEDLLAGRETNRENLKKLLEQGFRYPSSMGDIIVKPGSHEIKFKLYPARISNGKIDYLNSL